MTPEERRERKAHRDEITAAIEELEDLALEVDYYSPVTGDEIRKQCQTIATEADALK